MKKYEELLIKVIDRRKAKESCYCNRCKKLIYKRSCIESEELPKNKLWTHYWEVTIGHNDWGNDSCDSIEHFDICSPDCLNKELQLYIQRSDGNNHHNTEYIEIEHTSISCYNKGE